MIGLGRMGGNMAQRLLMAGHQVHAFDQNSNALDSSVALGASGAKSVADLVSQLAATTRRMAHVAGRRCHGIMYERPGRIAVGRGCNHRRRQRELSGNIAPGGDAVAAWHSLARCGNQRWHLGIDRRIFPDGGRG